MAPRTIFRLRRKLGLSQKAFAKKIGYSRITVSLWERGKLVPGRNAINAMRFWMPI